MKTRLLFVPLLAATVATLAACGGGSAAVPAGDVALVNSSPVTSLQFNAVLSQAEAQAKNSGQTVPAIGTPQYTALKTQIAAYLVEVAEVEQQAQKLDVKVTSKDVDTFLTKLAKDKYSGDMKKLLTTFNLTQAAISIHHHCHGIPVTERLADGMNLTTTKIRTKITSPAKVTSADALAYYKANISTYSVPAQSTRSVEHILVKSKSLANNLENQLKGGASFATLAKKYSKDPGSAAQGGKFLATKGKEVPAYDDAAFSLKTGVLSAPVDATASANGSFGWFIIKALGPVKNTKAHTTTFKQAQATIEQTLLPQKQQTLWSTYLANLAKQYAGKVSYGAGYAPPPTTAITTTPTG